MKLPPNLFAQDLEKQGVLKKVWGEKSILLFPPQYLVPFPNYELRIANHQLLKKAVVIALIATFLLLWLRYFLIQVQRTFIKTSI